VFHLGSLGAGHTVKLINNFYGMTIANAMAEAFAMADTAGVDRQALYDVMSSGPLHSNMMDFVTAYAVDGQAEALAFAIKNARKDLGYYSDMAEEAGADTMMSRCTRQALEEADGTGYSDRMVSEMVDFFAKRFVGGRDA
jgi:2-hydroxy-3-oxopropionate reductase